MFKVFLFDIFKNDLPFKNTPKREIEPYYATGSDMKIKFIWFSLLDRPF